MALLESTVARSRNTLQPGTEIITSRLDTYVLKALPEDLLTVLRGVAMDELSGQVTAGNLPSQILVDGRSVAQREILSATRSVSMRFADVTTMLSAIREAYALLQRVTRIQSPPQNEIVARQHFWLYKNGAPVGRLPGAFAKVSPQNVNYKTVLRVVGPLVNYGRKLYWSPIGRSKIMNIRQTTSPFGRDVLHYDSQTAPRFIPYRMRTIRKLANGMGGDPAENLRNMLANRPGYVEPAGPIVKRILRRDKRYSGLHISDGWISYPPAASWGKRSKNSRVPSISVQLARKGGLRVVEIV